MSNFVFGDWRVTNAYRLPEMVTRSNPTVAGLSLEKENTAIIFDRDEGVFQLSLEELTQVLNFDLFGSSFQSSLNDAFEQIESRHPDIMKRATPINFINEMQKMLTNAGAHAPTFNIL